MSKLSRSELDSLTSQLKNMSNAAKDVLKLQLETLEFSGTADLRNKLIEIMKPIVSASTEYAAVQAATFYDNVRMIAVNEEFGAEADSQWSQDATEGAIKALVNPVNNGASVAQIMQSLLDRTDYEIARAAGECIKINSFKDKECIGWARVPHGAETCPFCLMLASFGAQYYSEEAAGEDGHYHANCDCRIVPVFDAMNVEGYNPDDMYFRLLDIQKSLGGRGQLHEDFDALPEEERKRLIAKAGNKEGKARDRYINKRLAQGIKERGVEWFKTGIEPQESSSIRQLVLPKEEYAQVTHAINNVYHAKYDGKTTGVMPVGDNTYFFKIDDFGEYRFTGKEPIDE